MFGRTSLPPVLREDAWGEPPFGSLVLRKLGRRDREEWHRTRLANAAWLRPWEATIAPVEGEILARGGTYSEYIKTLDSEARSGVSFMWGMFLDEQFVGQISLGNIGYGSQRGAHVGYWVAQSAAGRGVTPTAVAMVVDFAFSNLKLHRIEVNIRPENAASLRVAEKLGLRFEGVRKSYLHINGQWADHNAYAITAEERPQGMMYYWRENA